MASKVTLTMISSCMTFKGMAAACTPHGPCCLTVRGVPGWNTCQQNPLHAPPPQWQPAWPSLQPWPPSLPDSEHSPYQCTTRHRQEQPASIPCCGSFDTSAAHVAACLTLSAAAAAEAASLPREPSALSLRLMTQPNKHVVQHRTVLTSGAPCRHTMLSPLQLFSQAPIIAPNTQTFQVDLAATLKANPSG